MKEYFDLDAVLEWCHNGNDMTVKEHEINEMYDLDENDFELTSKLVREVKGASSVEDSIRFQLFRLLFDNFVRYSNTENMAFDVIFNTMTKYKFIKEK
jgi:hypothetical protein